MVDFYTRVNLVAVFHKEYVRFALLLDCNFFYICFCCVISSVAVLKQAAAAATEYNDEMTFTQCNISILKLCRCPEVPPLCSSVHCVTVRRGLRRTCHEFCKPRDIPVACSYKWSCHRCLLHLHFWRCPSVALCFSCT